MTDSEAKDMLRELLYDHVGTEITNCMLKNLTNDCFEFMQAYKDDKLESLVRSYRSYTDTVTLSDLNARKRDLTPEQQEKVRAKIAEIEESLEAAFVQYVAQPVTEGLIYNLGEEVRKVLVEVPPPPDEVCITISVPSNCEST